MKIANNKSNYMVEIIESESGSKFYKTILKKGKDDLSVLFLETENVSFNKKSKQIVFLQLIDGESEIIVDENIFPLKLGQGFMIPVDKTFTIKTKEDIGFKIVLTRFFNDNRHQLNGLVTNQ